MQILAWDIMDVVGEMVQAEDLWWQAVKTRGSKGDKRLVVRFDGNVFA